MPLAALERAGALERAAALRPAVALVPAARARFALPRQAPVLQFAVKPAGPFAPRLTAERALLE